ncbi:MAG: MBL fold metallo-hydrolase [Acidobacteriales bacterium]|nr:MBL fold metallo-hydrolase [Terriglobales bacterium]
MSLVLTVHRGTHQIGGTCVEIQHPSGERLILDAGRQLDAPEGANDAVPSSLDLNRPATVLISHPHQDHWGVIGQLPVSWPILTGSKSAQLIAIPGELSRRPLMRTFKTWDSRTGCFPVGPFTVTPILTDHSAFDAYMLLIEWDGKRILYTGDFRRHGRKSILVDRIMTNPPGNIDVLIIEGTNLGTDKPVKTEQQIEEEFVALFNGTKGRVFVSWAGQNIDRTVTLYRAARRTSRTLVIDLYTADVLDRVSGGTGVPRADKHFSNLKVVITKRLRSVYGELGRENFIERMAGFGLSARNLVSGRHVIMLRHALIPDYERCGIEPNAEDAYSFSMWQGYLSETCHRAALEWCQTRGSKIAHIHTSGHASPADLRAFTKALMPKVVIPVHGNGWDEYADGFGNVKRLCDGEQYPID